MSLLYGALIYYNCLDPLIIITHIHTPLNPHHNDKINLNKQSVPPLTLQKQIRLWLRI